MPKTNDHKILVVDDDNVACILLEAMLARKGQKCTCVYSAEEALEELTAASYSIVLCDIMLPGMSGIDLLEQVSKQNQDAAFIMISGLDDRQTVARSLRLGAYAYIIKPVEREELFDNIEKVLIHRAAAIENRRYREKLEVMVAERTDELAKTNQTLTREIEAHLQSKDDLLITVEKLKEEEEKNRLHMAYLFNIIQSIPYPFYVIDVKDYSIVLANKIVAPHGDWHGKTCHSITHKSDTPCNSKEHVCPLQYVKENSKPIIVEHLHYDPNGNERFYEVHGYPIFNETGDLVQMIEFSIDINARKIAEKLIEKSENKMRAIFNEVQAGVVIIKPETREIVDINPAAAKIFGAAREEIIGHVCHKYLCPTESGNCPICDLGQSVNLSERVLVNKNGDHVPILKTVAGFRLDEEDFLLESFVDISEQKKAKESLEIALKQAHQLSEDLKNSQVKLLQQEKMASIGQLAAGVAHEINNPMGFIISNLGTLEKYVARFTEFIELQAKVLASLGAEDQVQEEKKKLKLDFLVEDSRELLHESLDGSKRVTEIVRNLKSFSRLDDALVSLSDINECIETTLKIIWNELKYKTTIHKEYGELPPTFCNSQELNQVFMNILINAVQAIETQGDITIRSWHEDNFIKVAITDTGGGIPADKLQRIFEPFFTTKDVGKGTGLGLSICYDIVKKHDGEIAVESEPGKGTTFTVKLPVKQDETV